MTPTKHANERARKQRSISERAIHARAHRRKQLSSTDVIADAANDRVKSACTPAKSTHAPAA